MVDSGTLSQLFWQREESIVASDCESIWSCDAEGLLEEELIDGCVTDATCVVEDNGLFGCQCDEGFTGSGTDSCEEDVNECHYVLAQNGSPVVIDVSIYISQSHMITVKANVVWISSPTLSKSSSILVILCYFICIKIICQWCHLLHNTTRKSGNKQSLL